MKKTQSKTDGPRVLACNEGHRVAYNAKIDQAPVLAITDRLITA